VADKPTAESLLADVPTPSADQLLGDLGKPSASDILDGRKLPDQKPHGSWWSEFGKHSGGVTGIVTAPFTSSIPIELAKGAAKDPLTYALTGPIGLVYKKVEQFLQSDPGKPLGERVSESFSDVARYARDNPGAFLGDVAHGLAADPESAPPRQAPPRRPARASA
jgi:hypothetical protein